MALKGIFKTYGFIMKNKRDLELAISLFLGCQKFRIFFLVIHHLAISEALIQRSFWVTLKITTGNLCKSFHVVIIIPFLT